LIIQKMIKRNCSQGTTQAKRSTKKMKQKMKTCSLIFIKNKMRKVKKK